MDDVHIHMAYTEEAKEKKTPFQSHRQKAIQMTPMKNSSRNSMSRKRDPDKLPAPKQGKLEILLS